MKHSNAYNAALISILATLGVILQFLFQLVTAFFFGTNKDIESYYVAFTIPTYVTTVIVFCINSSFVPRYLKIKAIDKLFADHFAKNSLQYSSLATIIIVTVAIIFNKQIIIFFFKIPNAELIGLSSKLSLFLWPTLMTNVLISHLSSKLQADKKYLLPSLLPLVGVVISIIVMFTFIRQIGIYALAIGILTSSIIQLILIIFINIDWIIKKSNYRSNEIKDWLKNILILGSGNTITRFAPVMERIACTVQPQGQLAELNYANRIATSLSSVISTGIGITGFTLLSELSGKNDLIRFKEAIMKLIRISLIITIPIALIIFLNSDWFIKILLFRGKFTLGNVNNVSKILNCYLIFFLFSNLGNVIGRGLYALNLIKIATILDVIGLFFYGLLLFVFAHLFGIFGIAISYSFYFLLFTCISAGILFYKLNYSISKSELIFVGEILVAVLFVLLVSLILQKIGLVSPVKVLLEFFSFPLILLLLNNGEISFFKELFYKKIQSFYEHNYKSRS